MNSPDLPRPSSADSAPPSAARRLYLLAVLVVVPFTLVCLPAALVFHFSTRQWTFASWGKARGEPDVSALRGSLERTAQKDLPPPDALDSAAIEVRSSPGRAAARVEKISQLAKNLGGSVAEGLPTEGRKHLFVELPAGRAGAFRDAIKGDGVPTPPPAPAGAAGAGKDHLEVILHLEDE